MNKCELIPLQEVYEDCAEVRDFDEEFYCETCGEYVDGPCNDDDQ